LQDPDVARLRKTVEASVELVRDLDGRLSPRAQELLSCASLAMINALFELTGKPPVFELIQSDKDVVF
jgi:hypothetical protein